MGPALDAEAQVRAYKAKNKIDFPLLSDADPASKAYLVPGYPMMYVVGKDRKIVWRGHSKDDKLEPAIEAALKAEGGDEGKAKEGAAKDAAKDAPAPALPVYKLKDGTEIKAKTVMDAGDEYVIKDDKGKFTTVKKDDVVEIKK